MYQPEQKKRLIGICGKPNAGKDTVADILSNELSLIKYGPSFPLKETAAKMFDVPVSSFYDKDKKEEVVPFWDMSPRKMAQLVGRECTRDIFGGDFWMRHVELKWTRITEEDLNDQGMVLPDIRYPEDAQWVLSRGGMILKVVRSDRPLIVEEQHQAENQVLPDEWITRVVENNGTLDDLAETVLLLARYIRNMGGNTTEC